MGFPGGSDSKASACNVGDLGSIPGLGRSPGEGKGYPLQYSGLKVANSWAQRSNFRVHFGSLQSGLSIEGGKIK